MTHEYPGQIIKHEPTINALKSQSGATPNPRKTPERRREPPTQRPASFTPKTQHPGTLIPSQGHAKKRLSYPTLHTDKPTTKTDKTY